MARKFDSDEEAMEAIIEGARKGGRVTGDLRHRAAEIRRGGSRLSAQDKLDLRKYGPTFSSGGTHEQHVNAGSKGGRVTGALRHEAATQRRGRPAPSRAVRYR